MESLSILVQGLTQHITMKFFTSFGAVLLSCSSVFAAQSVEVLALLGSSPAGAGGQTISFLGYPGGVPGGGMSCTIILTGNALPDRVGLLSGGSLVFNSTTSLGLQFTSADSGISSSGDIAAAGSTSSTQSIYTKDLGIIASTGSPAAGFSGLFYRGLSRPTVSSSGVLFWHASLSSTVGGTEVARSLYCKAPAGPVTPLVNTNSNILGLAHTGPSALSQPYDISPNGSNYVTVHDVVDGVDPVNILVRNGVTELTRTGLPHPGGAALGTINSLTNATVNNSGQWAVRFVTLSPSNSGILTSSDYIGSIGFLDNSALPGTSPQGLNLNNDGYVAALWGSPSSDHLLSINRIGLMGAGRIVARRFDQIDTDGDWVPDAQLLQIRGNSATAPQFFLYENKTIAAVATWQPNSGGPQQTGLIRFKNPIQGDANRDNEVGPADFALLAQAFGSFAGDANWDADCDFNWDGEVGPADFSILAAEFGNFGP